MAHETRVFLGKAWLAMLVFGFSAMPLALKGQTPGVLNRQKPASSSGSFVLHSQTNIVLVDVRVTTKNGKPVTDLTAKDFQVFEDRVPQTITSFSLENVEKLAQAGTAAGAPPTIDLAKLPATASAESVLQDHRLILLFFDVSSMQPDDVIRAVKSATDFVQTKLTPADLVSVVTYTSSLRVVRNFTNDRAALAKTLKGILVGEESTNLSAIASEGAAGGTNASGEEIVSQDVLRCLHT